MRVVAGAAVAILGAAAGVTIAVLQDRSRTEATVAPAPTPAPIANPDPVPAVDMGIVVEGDRLVASSYDKMIPFLADAFEQARRDGIRGAEPILATVFQRALPRYRWPPLPESPLAGQWSAMVKDLAALFEPGPEADPRTKKPGLRVV